MTGKTLLTGLIAGLEQAVKAQGGTGAAQKEPPLFPLGRGRPLRRANSGSQRERRLFRQDLMIANAVYAAVIGGMAYRDDALVYGQRVANRLGRRVSLDGIDAIIERLIADPEALFSVPPGRALRSLINVFGPFIPGLSVKNGNQKLKYKSPAPFLPIGDTGPGFPLRRKNSG